MRQSEPKRDPTFLFLQRKVATWAIKMLNLWDNPKVSPSWAGRWAADDTAMTLDLGPLAARLAGSGFTGLAYINNVKVVDLNSNSELLWIDCNLLTSTATEIAAFPDTPLPGHAYFEKAATVGNIVVWDWIPTGIAIPYTGSSTAVPAGFALCDGSANGLANGGSGVDLSGSFIVAVGTDEDDNSYTDRDTGGFAKHGGESARANNHGNHPLGHTHPQSTTHDEHTHNYAPTDVGICAGEGEMVHVYGWNTSAEDVGPAVWDGDITAITTGAPTWDDSSYNKHSETDNRPPWFALAYIERLNPT